MAPMLRAIVLATATGKILASDAECDASADEATLLQARPMRGIGRHVQQNSDLPTNLPAFGPLVTLHWNGGSANVAEETTCVSSTTQITGTFGVPNDQMTGISGLRAGCSVKLFEHSRHCRASADADDNCNDQRCLELDSNTMDLGALAGKVSGITVTCNPERQYRCLQQYNAVFPPRSKCNFNEGVIYVQSKEECEAHALANDHAFYSFRHNANSNGHKCFSSETCAASLNMEGKLIADRTNEWRVYANPDMTATQEGVYVGCYVDDQARDMGAMEGNRDNAGTNTWVNCMSNCACQGKPYFSLQWGGECFCSFSVGNGDQYVKVDDNECDEVQREPCSSSAIHCGGSWRQAIYRIAPSPEHMCEGQYEAEDATISGGVEHANVNSANHQGFTGRSFVDYLNPNNDYVEWTLEACSGGPATAKFRYALSSGNRPLELIVNGATVEASLGFPGCGANNWRTYCDVTAEVELAPGTNTVKLLATGSSGANMDHLEIRRHWHA